MTLPVLDITGYPVFDWFFSIGLYMGIVAIVPQQIFRLLRY